MFLYESKVSHLVDLVLGLSYTRQSVNSNPDPSANLTGLKLTLHSRYLKVLMPNLPSLFFHAFGKRSKAHCKFEHTFLAIVSSDRRGYMRKDLLSTI